MQYSVCVMLMLLQGTQLQLTGPELPPSQQSVPSLPPPTSGQVRRRLPAPQDW